MNQKPNRRHLHHLPFDVLEIIFNLLDCPRHRATPFDGTFSLPSTFLALRDPSSTKNLLHLASVNRAFRALLVPRLFEGVECVGGHDAVRWELEYLLSLESIHPYIRRFEVSISLESDQDDDDEKQYYRSIPQNLAMLMENLQNLNILTVNLPPRYSLALSTVMVSSRISISSLTALRVCTCFEFLIRHFPNIFGVMILCQTQVSELESVDFTPWESKRLSTRFPDTKPAELKYFAIVTTNPLAWDFRDVLKFAPDTLGLDILCDINGPIEVLLSLGLFKALRRLTLPKLSLLRTGWYESDAQGRLPGQDELHLGPTVRSDALINAVAIVLEICTPSLRLIRFSPDDLDEKSVGFPDPGVQFEQCVIVERDGDDGPMSFRWQPELEEVDESSMEQPECSEFGAKTQNDYGRRLFPVIKRAICASRRSN